MYVARRAALCLVSVVCVMVTLAGCAQSPTSPTSVSAPVLVGAAAQGSPSVPPRISVDPPRGVGVSRFLAFGDSITWGAYSSWDARFLFAAANGGYPERVNAGLNAYHQPQVFEVFNAGVPGEWASRPETLSRLRNLLTTRRPQALLLLEGINDLSSDQPVSRVISGLNSLITAAISTGVPVLVATMYQTYEVTPPPEQGGGLRVNGAPHVPEFNREIRRLVAGRANVHLVDLEPVMAQRRYVGNDGVHLTDEGFTVMSSAFIAAIERAFPVRGSFH